MCLRVSYKKKYEKKINFFAFLKSLKKGVGSGVESGSGAGSGSISQRYGFTDPYPHQIVTDPQHCFLPLFSFFTLYSRYSLPVHADGRRVVEPDKTTAKITYSLYGS
jgi:hypothetical protein